LTRAAGRSGSMSAKVPARKWVNELFKDGGASAVATAQFLVCPAVARSWRNGGRVASLAERIGCVQLDDYHRGRGGPRGPKCPAGSLLEYIEGLWRKPRGQGVES
jgi:hypothetical protein